MDLVARILSLRRRRRPRPPSSSPGSSADYGQPVVERLSSDSDQHRFQVDYPRFVHSGIPIRSTTPRSFPVLDHPIDRVPRREPSTTTPYTVKVHRRKLLHRTEFPHADPPRLPRKQSHTTPARLIITNNRSFRRVESTYSDSSDSNYLASSPPRLEMLRQDPSVRSLVSVMDARGSIPPTVFSNSPATPRPLYHRHPHPFSASTPELRRRSRSSVQADPSPQNYFNFRIAAAPDAVPARPKSAFLPSFPVHIFPSQNLNPTPESHSFSSLQAEQGSFSIPGDSSKKPTFSTHKSLTKASDAFRFLQHRYNNHLPPTMRVHNPRGPSLNGAVAESSTPPSSRTPHTPFVPEPERQQTLSVETTYNANLGQNAHTSFLTNSPGSQSARSSIISPLGSPLPVLTRIQPYSSSFSRAARRGSNHSSSDETAAPSPSRSLSDCSQEHSPRTPLTLGSPTYARTRALAIVDSPLESSAFDYAHDIQQLRLGHPTGFADREMIRTNRALHTISGAHDTAQNNLCQVPASSVYMQSSLGEDPIQSRLGRKKTAHPVPTREDRLGLSIISFNFNSGNNTLDSDGTSDDQQYDITPGRPTVVLVPSGRSRSDRGQFLASASESASVNLELEREVSGPRFALGHGPRTQVESESLSTTSLHAAHEIPVEPEISSRARCGDEHARNGTSGSPTISKHTSGTPRLPRNSPTQPHLDSSKSPSAASAGPALQVSSSSRSRDKLHHGTQFILYLQ
ncbi:hypothetical protein RhiJN_17103 [Ceratobasidium sp. AG-Ba]|nr:hypothetical protein RhiJN_17103 [Ceratobasidium sp. AG-Ba]